MNTFKNLAGIVYLDCKKSLKYISYKTNIFILIVGVHQVVSLVSHRTKTLIRLQQYIIISWMFRLMYNYNVVQTLCVSDLSQSL